MAGKTFETLALEGLLTEISDLDQFIVWDHSETTFAKTKVGQASVLAAYLAANISGISIVQVAGLTAALAALQPLNAELTNLSGQSSTGILTRTATATYTERQLVAPAAGITIANPDLVAGNATLALANDLAALEGLASTGIAVRSATDTWVQRQIAVPAAGISITNAGGVAGNPTLALANDLAALEGLASTGLAARTATDTWAQRTITGTANQITVTNGDGVAGNPTLSLPTALTFTGFTITGGTYASPTLTTPVLGVATATSINKVAITAPATGSTLTIADGKTATFSNTLTMTGTDGSSVNHGAGGTVAYVANNLSVFASTTSAQLAGVLSDETGTGSVVFGTNPTIAGGSHTALTGLGIRSTGAAFDLTLATSEVLTAGRTLSIVLGDAARTLTFTGNASITGTNTGDQTITLTSDVTGSGTGSFATTIAANAVTYAKFQQVAASSLVGNATGSLANATGITLGTTLAFSGSALQTAAGTGDVSWSANSFATAIGSAKITNTMLNNSVVTGMTANNSPNTTTDYIIYYNATDGTLRKATVGAISAAGASGVNTVFGRTGTVVATSGDYDGVAFGQTGLLVKGATSNGLTIKPNETLSAARTLNIITGDASRTMTFGGDWTSTSTVSFTGAFSTAGAVTHAGAFTQTFTATGNTSVTLPTSGTLLSTAAAVTVAQGGTGAATLTNHGVVIGQGTGNVAATGAGSAGQVLMSNGPSADPTFQTIAGATYTLLSTLVLSANANTLTFSSINSEDVIVEFDNIVMSGGSGAGTTLAISTDGTTFTTTPVIISSTSVAFGTTLSSGSFFMTGLKAGAMYASFMSIGVSAPGINNLVGLTSTGALGAGAAVGAQVVAFRIATATSRTWTSGTIKVWGRG